MRERGGFDLSWGDFGFEAEEGEHAAEELGGEGGFLGGERVLIGGGDGLGIAQFAGGDDVGEGLGEFGPVMNEDSEMVLGDLENNGVRNCHDEGAAGFAGEGAHFPEECAGLQAGDAALGFTGVHGNAHFQ